MKITVQSRFVIAFLAMVLIAVAPARAEEASTFEIAVVPQLPPLTTHKAWAPFVERIEQVTGLKLKLKIYDRIPEFEVDTFAGKPDFAFMNPYHAVMAKKSQGYIPLVRDGSSLLKGVVVVATHGPIRKVEDLNGKEIAFPAPNAFAASLYVRALLSSTFNLKFTPRYLETHTDVYRHVVLGEVMAGGAVNTTLARESDDIRTQLSILYETPPSAPHPLSAHPRVPQAARDAVKSAIIQLGSDPANAELLKGVQLKAPVAADYTRDYQPLEKLGLEKFVVPSK